MAEASGSGVHQFNNIFLSMRSGLVSASFSTFFFILRDRTASSTKVVYIVSGRLAVERMHILHHFIGMVLTCSASLHLEWHHIVACTQDVQ